MEIGFRFVNQMSLLATPDLSPRTTSGEIEKASISWVFNDYNLIYSNSDSDHVKTLRDVL